MEPSKIYPFEKQIVGKNLNKVYTLCQANHACGWGVNMPLNKQCGNCNDTEHGVTYYDAETIQNFIDERDQKQKQLIQLQQQYIKLLSDELDSTVGLAYLHGWQSKNYEEDKKLREQIAAIEKEII